MGETGLYQVTMNKCCVELWLVFSSLWQRVVSLIFLSRRAGVSCNMQTVLVFVDCFVSFLPHIPPSFFHSCTHRLHFLHFRNIFRFLSIIISPEMLGLILGRYLFREKFSHNHCFPIFCVPICFGAFSRFSLFQRSYILSWLFLTLWAENDFPGSLVMHMK